MAISNTPPSDPRDRRVAIVAWGLAFPAIIVATALRLWVVGSAWYRPALSQNPEVVASTRTMATLLDATRTSLCAVATVCLLAIATAAVARTRRQFFVALVVWQLLVALALIVETAGGVFAIETGSPLDLYVLIAAMAPKVHKLVFATTASIMQLAVISAVTICFLVPWLAVWRGPPRWIPRWRPRTWLILAAMTAALAAVELQSTADARGAVIKSPLASVAAQTVDAIVGPAAKGAPSERAPGVIRAGDSPQHVVIIFLESTRRDAVTPYNEDLATTPNLAKLAEESLVFDNAYVPLPSTSKAFVASLCGIYPDPTVYFTAAAPGRLPQRCLPHLLADAGYASLFIQPVIGSFQFYDATVNNLGFEDAFHLEDLDTRGFRAFSYLGYEEPIMLEPSEAWVAENKDRPFLLTYLTISSHHDYRVPPDQLGTWVDDELQNRYLSAVSLVDDFVGEVVEMLKRQGVWDDTVLVVLGDHGEAFGEHYLHQHNAVLYEEVVRIPLLIRDPDKPGRRVEETFLQMDLLPTIVELAGHELAAGDYDGLALRALPAHRRFTLYCLYERQCMGTVDWPYKFIHNYGLRPDELYDLSVDRGETENVAAEHPDVAAELFEHVADEWVRIRLEHGAKRVLVPAR